MQWNKKFSFVAIWLIANALHGATLTTATQAAWDTALLQAKQSLNQSIRADHFMPGPESLQSTQPLLLELRSPRREGQAVPNGLLHHWTGTIFMPRVGAADVVRVLKDFDHYADTFRPAVVESMLIRQTDNEYEYRLRLVQKGFGVKAAVIGTFRTTFVDLDGRSGYSITEALQLDELKGIDSQANDTVPFAAARGYLERTATLVRYRELANGTQVQLESLSLSRDVPGAIRWLANPLIRRFAAQTMINTLNVLSLRVEKVAEGGDALRASVAGSR